MMEKYPCVYLDKDPNRDFIVLNLTDIQLLSNEVRWNMDNYRIAKRTIEELIHTIQPDLITLTGDFGYADDDLYAYHALADLLETFQIPWAPIWGNHDNQEGNDGTKKLAEIFKKRSMCIYQDGDPVMGNGNYTILICENGKPIEALFMMDSHDRVNLNGYSVDAKIIPEQLDWYRSQVLKLKAQGCRDSTIMLHVPIHAYRTAYAAAIKNEIEVVSLLDDNSSFVWNSGYEDSFGVRYGTICTYPEEDGVLSVLEELDHTHHVLAGHDHMNNFSIKYHGVRLTYSLKTGSGHSWNPKLNGGTVLRINHDGVYHIYHAYMDGNPSS